MATRIVAEAAADRLRNLLQIRDQVVDRECSEIGVILEGIIGVGDVSLMVLAVMNFHRAGINVRFESVRRVG